MAEESSHSPGITPTMQVGSPTSRLEAAGLFQSPASVDPRHASHIHDIWQAWAEASENISPSMTVETFTEELFYGWRSDMPPGAEPKLDVQFSTVVIAGHFTESCKKCSRCKSDGVPPGTAGALILARIKCSHVVPKFTIEFTYSIAGSNAMLVIDEPLSRCDIAWYPNWKDIVKQKVEPDILKTVCNWNERFAVWMGRNYLHYAENRRVWPFGLGLTGFFSDATEKAREARRLWEMFDKGVLSN